jgi:hypothetical protein
MHVPCASAAGRRQRQALPWRAARRTPGHIPVGAARSKRLRYGIQCSRMRLSARRPAQNLLAASRDPAGDQGVHPTERRRLGCSRQRRDEGGLLPLAGSPTSEPVRRCGPELPYESADTRRCHHAQLQHRGQVVPGGPVLSQFSVLNAELVALLTGEPLATRRQEPGASIS